MKEDLKFETKYRLVYDFKDQESLDTALAVLRGIGMHWYRVYRIEEA